MSSKVTTVAVLLSLTTAASAVAQEPCARLTGSWWQVGVVRFGQTIGSGQRMTGVAIERQFVDRRTLRRSANGYRLDVRRTKLGLRDETVNVVVEYGANGVVTGVSGDTAAIGREVSQLVMARCTELRAGAALPDLGGRVDSVHTPSQRSITRVIAAHSATVGVLLDTLGMRLLPITVRRSLTDTSSGLLVRQTAGSVTDTVRPWTVLAGEETERQLVRVADGTVMFREHARKLNGRGWAPPHAITDTVPVRVESVTIERVVDSVVAAGVLTFPRRGEVTVSAAGGDTAALHYREWRGDTLVVRQVRRSGWRDELRTVWRDSALISASLYEPGSAAQQPGPFYRPFRVQKGFLFDGGTRDSSVATPASPWSLALDGFEDVLVPAMLALPADEKPHPFALYTIVNGRGNWLSWTATVAARGPVRVAKFFTLQKKWAGSFIYTPTGELLLSSLGGAGGVFRVPMTGTRLAGLLEAAQAHVKREDLVPVGATPAAPPAGAPVPARKP